MPEDNNEQEGNGFTCFDCINANEHECYKCGEAVVYCDYWTEFVANPSRVMYEGDCEGAVV